MVKNLWSYYVPLLIGNELPAAAGTPVKAPPIDRRRPPFQERPHALEFAPLDHLSLRLDPNPEERRESRRVTWASKVTAPLSRVVWIGSLMRASGSSVPQVEVLVERLRPDYTGIGELEAIPMPITALGPLSVGRIIHDERPSARPAVGRFGRTGPQLRFLYDEWIIELTFGGGRGTIQSAEALGIQVAPLPERYAAAPLYVHHDPAAQRFVIIPCWEIFRFYYAQIPLVARLIFDFPKWDAKTEEKIGSYFDGHQFRSRDGHYPWTTPIAIETVKALAQRMLTSHAINQRADLLAIPPFSGDVELHATALPCILDKQEALFVQEIHASLGRYGAIEGSTLTRWWREPVTPAFQSEYEAVAWWSEFTRGDYRLACYERGRHHQFAGWQACVAILAQYDSLVLERDREKLDEVAAKVLRLAQVTRRIRPYPDPQALRAAGHQANLGSRS